MNLEGITINILTSRLQEKLLGGKIYKVFMPNKSSLLLLVKTENAAGRRAHYQNNAKRPGPRYYNGNKQHRQRKANYQQTAYF